MSNTFTPTSYLPPDPAVLPEQYAPAIERIVTLRQRWAEATDRANAARKALRDAPEEFRVAVTEAAAAGKDVTKVPDPRPAAREDLELREMAETGLASEVLAATTDLWNAVASDYPSVLAHVHKPCEDATAKIADLEQQLAQARAELATALGVRRWVVGKRRPAEGDYVRLHAAPPRPMPDTTLAEVLKAEARALAAEEQSDKAKQIQRQRQEQAEQQYAAIREQQTKRREAARLR